VATRQPAGIRDPETQAKKAKPTSLSTQVGNNTEATTNLGL